MPQHQKPLKRICINTVLFFSIISLLGRITITFWERYSLKNELTNVKHNLYSLKETITDIGNAYDTFDGEISDLITLVESKQSRPSVPCLPRQELEKQRCKNKCTVNYLTTREPNAKLKSYANEALNPSIVDKVTDTAGFDRIHKTTEPMGNDVGTNTKILLTTIGINPTFSTLLKEMVLQDNYEFSMNNTQKS